MPLPEAKGSKARMLVCVGGLESDENCHVFDENRNIIPGLYVAGNMQGNRFAVEYPTTVPGISHSMALTYGKIAGENVVKGILGRARKSNKTRNYIVFPGGSDRVDPLGNLLFRGDIEI